MAIRTRLKAPNGDIPPLSNLIGRSVSVALTNAVPLYGVLRLGWNAFALVLMFILEGVMVLVTDSVKRLFDKGDKKTRGILFFEFVFILFFGFFAVLVFGPYESLESAVMDRFRLVGALFSGELRKPLAAVVFMRFVRLAHDLMDSGAFGGRVRRKLQLDGGGWMFLLFFAVMLAPLIAKSGPNPLGGLAALVVLKILGEVLGVWAMKIKNR
jgi:hypothetical protein